MSPWLVFSRTLTVPRLGVCRGSDGNPTGRAGGSSGGSVYAHGPWVTFGGESAGWAAAAGVTGAVSRKPRRRIRRSRRSWLLARASSRSSKRGGNLPMISRLPLPPKDAWHAGLMSTELIFRGRRLSRDRALVMAIVNRTPDSFYDKGATFSDHGALAAVDLAVAEGADIVDIGGGKAGRGAEVDVEEEIRRVVPFVEEIRHRHPAVVISVDTWRHEVGRYACEAGADLLNDTWA